MSLFRIYHGKSMLCLEFTGNDPPLCLFRNRFEHPATQLAIVTYRVP
jgi:hypothetical protein